MKKVICLILLCFVVFSVNAGGMDYYINKATPFEKSAYNAGVQDAVMAINIILKQQGTKPLFCLPNNYEISNDDIHNVIMNTYNSSNDKNVMDVTPPGFLAVLGLPLKFPCK